MMLEQEIAGGHFWWFRELYSVLAALADEPENTIARLDDEIAAPVALAEELGNFLRCIREAYPEANLAVLQLVEGIDEILARRSLGGEDFDMDFWSNEGFQEHLDWEDVRSRTRAFLLR